MMNLDKIETCESINSLKYWKDEYKERYEACQSRIEELEKIHNCEG